MKYLLLALLLAVALSTANLNLKYASVLSGSTPLTLELAQSIYSQFPTSFPERSLFRFKVFQQRLQTIVAHNQRNLSWKKGLNSFSDMTYAEIRHSRILMAPQECSATHHLQVSKEERKLAIPDAYDWNELGVVTPVKDQGNCGSCWTFSTVGSLEAIWNIKKLGKNVDFSEQQLVDCAGDYNNFGCDGGLPSQAFEYIRAAEGIETESTYPYQAKDLPCVYNRARAVGYVKFGSYNITQNDENELGERLFSVGPQAVTYDVEDDFFDYESGVYRSDDCGTTTDDVNHAVVLTGYGSENGLKYWRVKNSWGTGWGNQGYFQIERGVNMCAIAQCNSYPLVDENSLAGLLATQ